MSTSTRITTERLLAVQRALDGTRVEEEVDILLDSIVVALSTEGAMAEEALVRHVCDMWPGSRLQPERVVRAARAGVVARVLVEQPTLDGSAGYGLLAQAGPSPDHADRVADILARTREGVRTRFREELHRELAEDEGEHLTTVLIDALAAGIRQAFDIYSGAVKKLSTDTLVPERWDKEAITESLDAMQFDSATRQVMGALALSAIDPGSRFGSDIVTQLATGRPSRVPSPSRPNEGHPRSRNPGRSTGLHRHADPARTDG